MVIKDLYDLMEKKNDDYTHWSFTIYVDGISHNIRNVRCGQEPCGGYPGGHGLLLRGQYAGGAAAEIRGALHSHARAL